MDVLVSSSTVVLAADPSSVSIADGLYGQPARTSTCAIPMNLIKCLRRRLRVEMLMLPKAQVAGPIRHHPKIFLHAPPGLKRSSWSSGA